MRVGEASSVESGVVGSMRDGVLEQKFLLTGRDGDRNNYLLNVGRTGTGGWTTPRHKHNFDQIRYVIKGNYPYAKGKSMPEGSVAYFPEGVPYGPQDRPEGLEMMVCQFGGASGSGYLSVTQREAANDALQKKGEFNSGVFTFGVILQTVATHIPLFVAGRFFAGLGVVLLSATIPLYQSETAPKWIRGTIVGCYQWAITIGLLLAAIVLNTTKNRNDTGSYRIPVAVQFAWAIILVVGGVKPEFILLVLAQH